MKSHYFRYSHVLYRITTLEKSERFDLLPHDSFKLDSTADIFQWKIQFFFGKAISQNISKPLIVKSFYLLRISNDCCFRRAAQGQLSQCNRGNAATVLRTVIKSHKGLKITRMFPCWCSGRNLKNFSTFAGKSPWWKSFIVKLQPAIAYKKSQSKDYLVNFIKKGLSAQRLLNKYFL